VEALTRSRQEKIFCLRLLQLYCNLLSRFCIYNMSFKNLENMKIVSLLIILCLFLGCKQNKIDPNNKLIGGVWVFDKVDLQKDGSYLLSYNRKKEFNNQLEGMSFVNNSQLIYNQNIGFCSPMIFTQVNEKWTQKGKIITLNLKAWDGTKNKIKYSLVSVSDSRLELKSDF
jgi:hypothetical protein